MIGKAMLAMIEPATMEAAAAGFASATLAKAFLSTSNSAFSIASTCVDSHLQ